MKKKTLLWLILMICAVMLSGCGNEVNDHEDEVEYEEIYAVVEEYNGLSKQTKTFSDYTYDEQTGSITGYVEKEGADKTSHKLTYDEEGRLIYEDEETSDTLTLTYEYNEDNTISKLSYKSTNENDINDGKIFEYREYKKDDKGRVISYCTVNVTVDNYRMDYTFEYDDEDRVVVETQKSPSSTYKIKYEYDDDGRKIKETVYKGNSSSPSYHITFKYDVVGKYVK